MDAASHYTHNYSVNIPQISGNIYKLDLVYWRPIQDLSLVKFAELVSDTIIEDLKITHIYANSQDLHENQIVKINKIVNDIYITTPRSINKYPGDWTHTTVAETLIRMIQSDPQNYIMQHHTFTLETLSINTDTLFILNYYNEMKEYFK